MLSSQVSSTAALSERLLPVNGPSSTIEEPPVTEETADDAAIAPQEDPSQEIPEPPLEDKPGPVQSNSVSVSVNHASSTINTPDTASLPQKRKNLLALFSAITLLYFVMFYCWQKVADTYGEKFWDDTEKQNLFYKYVKFCLSTGAAELGAGVTANLALTYFELIRKTCAMKRWTGWDCFSAFLTGTLWQLYADLGKLVGGGFSIAGNPYSGLRVGLSIPIIFAGNFLTLVSVNKLKESSRITNCLSFFGGKLKQLFTCGKGKSDSELAEEVIDVSSVADSTGNTVFFGMAPLNLGSISPPGDRTAFPAALVSAVGTATAQIVVEKYKSFRRSR